MRTFWILISLVFVFMAAFVVQPWKWIPSSAPKQSSSGVAAEASALSSRGANSEQSSDPANDLANAAAKPATANGAESSLPTFPATLPATVPPTPPLFATNPPNTPAVVLAPATNADPAVSTEAASDSGTPGHTPPDRPAVPDGAPKIDTFTVIPSTSASQADGSVLYDEVYLVKGDGSKENPYEVTWEMLTSVERTYNPAVGKREVPERIAMLNDKYVRIKGYVAFPLMVQQPKELLGMLNQWDGCCIGVPPTPYDAIEVRLNVSILGDDRYATYGTIEGVFTIQPYVVSNWLIGLYVMDKALLASTEFGGSGF